MLPQAAPHARMAFGAELQVHCAHEDEDAHRMADLVLSTTRAGVCETPVQTLNLNTLNHHRSLSPHGTLHIITACPKHVQETAGLRLGSRSRPRP